MKDFRFMLLNSKSGLKQFITAFWFTCCIASFGANVEITEVREDYDFNILGIVKNVSLPASRFSVRFVTFDEDGNKLGEHSDLTPELKPGESARFKVSIYSDRDAATRYEFDKVRHGTDVVHSVSYSIAPVPEMFLTVRNRYTARAANAAREEEERIQKRIAESNRLAAIEFSRRPIEPTDWRFPRKLDPEITNLLWLFNFAKRAMVIRLSSTRLPCGT